MTGWMVVCSVLTRQGCTQGPKYALLALREAGAKQGKRHGCLSAHDYLHTLDTLDTLSLHRVAAAPAQNIPLVSGFPAPMAPRVQMDCRGTRVR